MAITDRTASAYQSTGAVTTAHTISAPATIVDGDILELWVAYRSDGANDNVWTPPTGFTIKEKNDVPLARGIAVAWKRASGESGDYAFSFSQATSCSAWMMPASGAKTTGDPYNASAQADDPSGTADVVMPTVTTTVDGCRVRYGAMLATSTNSQFTPPAGVTEQRDHGSSSTASNVNLMVARETTDPSAGTTPARTFTTIVTGSTIPVIIVALEPAVASDAISPSNPTVINFSKDVLHARAGYAVDSGSDAAAVAAFEYSINGGSNWLAPQAADVVEYVRASDYAEIWIGNLPPGGTVHVRVTWSGVTINGTNPRYIGGTSSPGTGTTMLSQVADPDKLVNGTPQYDGARVSFHWTEHTDVVGASNLADDDHETVATADSLFQNPPTNSTRRTYYSALRATGTAERIWAYRIYEIRTSSGTPVTLSTTLLYDDTARDEWIALAAADETVYLHSAEPVSSANRLTRDEDTFVKLIPNLEHADVLAFIYRQHKRFDVEYFGTGQADSDHRADDLIIDNYFVEHDRMELPVDDSPVEYTDAAALHAAYDTLTTTLQQSGIKVGANVLVNNDTTLAEVQAVGDALDLWWFETAWTSFASSTPAYRTDAQWETFCDIVEAGVAAGKMVVCNGQIVDTSASYSFSADDLKQQDFIWASWMLCVDAAREMVTFRAFDSSSNGTRRFRTRPNWNLDTGNPTGARTFDGSSGTTPSGIWYREFDNGTVYLNITSSSKSSTIPDVGTLAAREALWIAGPVEVSGAAALTGSASLTASASVTVSGAASLTASASLTVAADVEEHTLVAVFPAVRPRIHVGIYEPLGSPQQGQPLAHMDIDVDVTALTWTERLPGGANTMEIGLESPRERSGWGDSLAFIPQAIRTKFFADVIVKAGPVPVWRGRWVENIIGPDGVQGGIIDGYGVSAVNDDYFESTDTVATTTGAVTQQLLTDAAPLLLKGNSSEWSDPGVAHAPVDAHGMTPAEWLDQVSKEGGTANVSWDWYLTPDLRVVLLPRTAPDTPHYRVGYDPERMDMRENVRECFGTVVVVYTRDGVEQETAEDTNPLFASIYGIRRRLRIVGDEMTPEGALQLQQTQLARRLEPSLSVTMDLGTGEYLTAPSGVPVPHWLVRAGQWVDIADRGQFVIVNLNYNARTDEMTLDLGEPSRADFDAYLADTCASVTKLAVGINPRYGGKRGRVRQLSDTGTAATASFSDVNTYLNALRSELLDKHLMG